MGDGRNETSKREENLELVVGLQFQLTTYIVQYTVPAFIPHVEGQKPLKTSLVSLVRYTLNFQMPICAMIRHYRFDR